jgi:hypothetical protein
VYVRISSVFVLCCVGISLEAKLITPLRSRTNCLQDSSRSMLIEAGKGLNAKGRRRIDFVTNCVYHNYSRKANSQLAKG